MSPRLFWLAAIAAAFAVAPSPILPTTPAFAGFKMVGGAQMLDTVPIIANLSSSQAHTKFIAAVQAAGLAPTLSGPGPFTVFAPTNDGFAKLPDGMLDTLLKPENKAQLAKVLNCHVVAGSVMAAALEKMIADDKGSHAVKTIGGCVLQARLADGGKITLTDENGSVARVTIADVQQSNGVVHVVNNVFLPKK